MYTHSALCYEHMHTHKYTHKTYVRIYTFWVVRKTILILRDMGLSESVRQLLQHLKKENECSLLSTINSVPAEFIFSSKE